MGCAEERLLQYHIPCRVALTPLPLETVDNCRRAPLFLTLRKQACPVSEASCHGRVVLTSRSCPRSPVLGYFMRGASHHPSRVTEKHFCTCVPGCATPIGKDLPVAFLGPQSWPLHRSAAVTGRFHINLPHTNQDHSSSWGYGARKQGCDRKRTSKELALEHRLSLRQHQQGCRALRIFR